MLDNAKLLFNPVLRLKMVDSLQDSNVNQVQSDRVVCASSPLNNNDGQVGEGNGDHFDVIDPANVLWSTQAIGFLKSVSIIPLPTSVLFMTTKPPTDKPTKASYTSKLAKYRSFIHDFSNGFILIRPHIVCCPLNCT